MTQDSPTILLRSLSRILSLKTKGSHGPGLNEECCATLMTMMVRLGDSGGSLNYPGCGWFYLIKLALALWLVGDSITVPSGNLLVLDPCLWSINNVGLHFALPSVSDDGCQNMETPRGQNSEIDSSDNVWRLYATAGKPVQAARNSAKGIYFEEVR